MRKNFNFNFITTNNFYNNFYSLNIMKYLTLSFLKNIFIDNELYFKIIIIFSLNKFKVDNTKIYIEVIYYILNFEKKRYFYNIKKNKDKYNNKNNNNNNKIIQKNRTLKNSKYKINNTVNQKYVLNRIFNNKKIFNLLKILESLTNKKIVLKLIKIDTPYQNSNIFAQ